MLAPRALRRVVLALVASAALGTEVAAAQAPPGTYCDPAASHFDPADVPPGGSTIATNRRVRQRRIDAARLETSILEAGRRRSREAVVFIHGNPGSSQDWNALLPRLGRKGRRAVAVDLPGFGHADKPFDGPYELRDGADFLSAVLRKLRIRRVHLVVHDIGGVIGMEWSASHPTRLESAVLLASGVLLGYRHHQYAQIWRTPAVGEAAMSGVDRQRFHSLVQNGQRRPLPPDFVDRMYDDFDRATRCAVLATYRSADEAEIAEFSRRQADALAPHDLPALVIWGRHDPYLPVEMAERQREAFPGARIALFGEAAHWPFVDHLARTRKLVVSFIRRHWRRRGAAGRA